MNIETNKKKKQIAILGSTGSIGTQALQVIEEHPDLYEAYALTANNRVELLIAQARKFQPADEFRKIWKKTFYFNFNILWNSICSQRISW